MQITLANKSKYDIEVKFGVQNLLINSFGEQNIDVNGEALTIRVSILEEKAEGNSFERKITKVINNAMLFVDCTYEIKDICDGMKLDITHEIYEFSGEPFFLPFLYLYSAVKCADASTRLVSCFGKNEKEAIKQYRRISLLAHLSGFDFLISLFSYVFEVARVKKLCKNEKIFKTVNTHFSTLSSIDDMQPQ